MTPSAIFPAICTYSGKDLTVVCDLHSACQLVKGRVYMCGVAGSKYPVLEFDGVKTKADEDKGFESRSSVDAIAIPPSQSSICFVELKSWALPLSDKPTEAKITKKAAKYASSLPRKLSDSIEICREIIGASDAFEGCRIVYVLLTDISVEDNGLESLEADLSALAGISSNFNHLCNELSKNIMVGIPDVESRYWECREFDNNILTL